MKKLQLKDLLSALSPQQQEVKQKQNVKTSNATHQFLQAPSQKIKQLPLRQQLKLKRQGTYRNTQQQMDKWIGIVKLNREKQTLNFAVKQKDNAASVGFFPAAPISEFHSKIEGQLKKLELNSQKAILSKQEQALAKMSKEQAKERLKQARKQRTLQFNEQIKRRRIAKIKSKLYHKIKKRQKLREEAKRIQGLEGEQKNEYLQKLTRQRINQRITLRHKSKNKHIQNLLRFNKGNKEGIQQSINEVNAIRHQQLQRANEAFREENISDQIDEQNYREQLEDIQQQIDQIQNDESKEKGLDGMKFMKIGLQKQLMEEKKQAKSLLKLLDDPQAMDLQQDVQEVQQQEQKEITRRKFGEANQKQSQSKTNNQNFIQRNLKKALLETQQLTQGIDVNRLKQKYQPQRSDLDLTQAIKIHKQAFNTNNAVIQENYKDFQGEKYQDYEAQVPEDKKKLKGWGNWAGPGISEPKVDHAAEVKKKLAKIEQIKRKRRDGQMSGVIIRETYNKNLKDYFVSKVPFNCKSAEQFDYMQNQKLGLQWNTLNQFSTNITPKVITKVGKVIEAIKMPKYLQKNKK